MDESSCLGRVNEARKFGFRFSTLDGESFASLDLAHIAKLLGYVDGVLGTLQFAVGCRQDLQPLLLLGGELVVTFLLELPRIDRLFEFGEPLVVLFFVLGGEFPIAFRFADLKAVIPQRIKLCGRKTLCILQTRIRRAS